MRWHFRGLATQVRLVATTAAFGLVSSLLGGCQETALPALIEVHDTAPRHVEAMEMVEIHGSGFPIGRPARVSFRGTLFRPGQRPLEGAVILASGKVASEGEVDVVMNEVLEQAFTVAGGSRVHTTFRGEVEVSFPPLSAGSPPVYGVLSDTVLDVRPPLGEADDENAKTREGATILASAGIVAEPTDGNGLVIQSVVPGSPADRLGLSASDKLVSFAGVELGRLADCALPGRLDTVPITLRREGAVRDEPRELTVDASGSHPSPLMLATCIGLIGFAGLLASFLGLRPLWLAWAARALMRLHRKTPIQTLPRVVLSGLRGWEMLLAGVLFALLSAVPFSRYLLIRDIDVALLIAASCAAFLVVGMAQPRVPSDGRLVRSLRVLALPIPMLLATLATVVKQGTLRISDLASDQGFWPWEWRVFESPLTLALVLIALLSIALPAGAPKPGPSLRLATLVLQIFVAYTVTALFLGAYRLPHALEREGGSVLGSALAFLWLLGKSIGFLLAAHLVRLLTLPLPWKVRRTLAARTLPAFSATLFLLTLVIVAVKLPPLFGAISVGSTCALTVLVLLRTALEAQRARGEALNPLA